MIRKTLALMLSYLLIGVAVFVLFNLVYKILGPEKTFRPGTYDLSVTWILLSVLIGLAAAMLGGYACVLIARDPKAANSLAVLILILGVASAALQMLKPRGEAPRDGSLSANEAMSHAREPLWMMALNPLIGAAGALIGGRLKKLSARLAKRAHSPVSSCLAATGLDCDEPRSRR